MLKKTLFLGIALSFCTSILFANTLDVPLNYSTIQSALNSAGTGDTILVQAGVYNEYNITWPNISGIKLIGIEGRDNTIIDAQRLGNVINIQSSLIDSHTVIKGFTIRNGWATADKGGGLYLENCSPSLENLSISDNTSGIERGKGGGIYCLSSSPRIENCLIASNTAFEGGGLFCMLSSPRILNSQIMNNTCELAGGGLIIVGPCSLILDHVIIARNESEYYGGGIACTDTASITISNSIIYDNEVNGILCDGNSTMLIEHSELNNSPYNLYVKDGNITIRHSNIYNSGIYNENSQKIVSATNCWWGDDTGPNHPSQNPSGLGVSVNQNVDILPWDSQPDTTAPPLPPSAIDVMVFGKNSLGLIWNSSQSSDVAGYKACYKTDENSVLYTDTLDVGNGNSGTITGLLSGVTYYISLISYDDNGKYSRYSYQIYGSTKAIEIRDMDIGDDEDMEHLVDHHPEITYDYYDSMGELQKRYHIQVSSHADFSSIDMWDTGEVESDTSSFIYNGLALQDGNPYYLRIRGGDGIDWSDYANLSFRMNSKPSIPNLLYPINDKVIAHHPDLNFLKSTDAENDSLNYSVYIYDQENDLSPLDSIIALSQDSDTISWDPSMEFTNDIKYSWKTRSFDGYEYSGFSDIENFIFYNQNDTPYVFLLLSPGDSTQISTLQPSLKWRSAIDPDPYDTVNYILYLDTPEPGVMEIDAGKDTSYTFIEKLEDNTKYYWKVLAKDLSGATSESIGGYQSFTVNTGNDAPSSPLISSPDSVVVLKLYPEFIWEASTDPDPDDHIKYQVNIWNTVFSDSMESDSNRCVLADSLMDNSEYFWYVKAMDDHSGISYSETVNFWTDLFAEPPANFSTVYPTHEEVLQSTSPTNEGILQSINVNLIWNSAADPDPQDIVRYTLRYKSIFPDSTAWNEVETGTDTSCSLDLLIGHRYEWQVKAKDDDGFEILSDSSNTKTFDVGNVTGLAMGIPEEYALTQNYPNPFNPTTTLEYALPELADIRLTIYNLMGRKIKQWSTSLQQAGWHKVIWDGRDMNGNVVSTGVYIYSLHAGDPSTSSGQVYVDTKKMVFMK